MIHQIVQIMALLGIPTIFTIVCGLCKAIITQGKRIQILMDAQQAQMRRDLLEDYYKFKKTKTVTERDLSAWEAQYKAYHELGANGVLDKIHEKVLSYDIVPEED